MDKKTKRRLGALRRLLDQQKSNNRMMVYDRNLMHFVPYNEAYVDRQIAILKKRIPADVLAREGLL